MSRKCDEKGSVVGTEVGNVIENALLANAVQRQGNNVPSNSDLI